MSTENRSDPADEAPDYDNPQPGTSGSTPSTSGTTGLSRTERRRRWRQQAAVAREERRRRWYQAKMDAKKAKKEEQKDQDKCLADLQAEFERVKGNIKSDSDDDDDVTFVCAVIDDLVYVEVPASADDDQQKVGDDDNQQKVSDDDVLRCPEIVDDFLRSMRRQDAFWRAVIADSDSEDSD